MNSKSITFFSFEVFPVYMCLLNMMVYLFKRLQSFVAILLSFSTCNKNQISFAPAVNCLANIMKKGPNFGQSINFRMPFEAKRFYFAVLKESEDENKLGINGNHGQRHKFKKKTIKDVFGFNLVAND